MSTLLLPANVTASFSEDLPDVVEIPTENPTSDIPEQLETIAPNELRIPPEVQQQLDIAIESANRLGIEVLTQEAEVDFLVVDAMGELNHATWKVGQNERLVFSLIPEDPKNPSTTVVQHYTLQRFDTSGKLLAKQTETFIPEEAYPLYEDMQEIDEGTKKLSRRGPYGHAAFFGKDVAEVFPRGKKVMVVGDPFLVFGEACERLGCESMTIVEYAPQDEIPTPLYSMLDSESHWRSWNYTARENIILWLNGTYEYDLKSLDGQGYSSGVGLNYDHLVPEYDHTSTEHINQGSVYNSLYGVYADICNMVVDVDEANSLDEISDIVDKYRARFGAIKGRYDSGFYAGERSAVEHMYQYESRDVAFSHLVEQARGEWDKVFTGYGLDSSISKEIESEITELETLGTNARAGIRIGSKFSQNIWELMNDLEEKFPRDKEERSDRYIELEFLQKTASYIRGLNSKDREERIAETFLTRYEQHLDYFGTIYPHLIKDKLRMEEAGVPAGTIRKVLTSNEEKSWQEQFKISQKGSAAIVHGYYPKIEVEPDSQDVIVSLYAHTAHGWSALETIEEMEHELSENIKFLRVGGKMYAGPINHKKLVALQREYDNTDYNPRIANLLSVALEEMHNRGEIDFEVVCPNSMKKDDKDYGPNSVQFLKDHGFANGIIVTKLK